MTIDEKVRDQKLRYDINMTAAKLSALFSGKIYKCEYLTGKKSGPRTALDNRGYQIYFFFTQEGI